MPSINESPTISSSSIPILVADVEAILRSYGIGIIEAAVESAQRSWMGI